MTVVDIRPPGPKDGRGLSSFYLVIGWVVGGYLAAAILAVAGGARPANARRTVIRLGALALYAVVSGLGGALVAGPVLGALPGHFFPVWGIGALVVFAAAAATAALQTLFGLVGIGLAILLFVVLGNPSAQAPTRSRCCRRSGARSAAGCRRARPRRPSATPSTSPATPRRTRCGCWPGGPS
ncbi:hypothetical protein ACFQY7_14470 [Actinomadura luteofluorescens]|uniref:hypothetical protein n=1 Tax=Actinomadura luteofluorescens TaxID=46163 RepID=UPI00363C5E7E